MGNKNNGVEGLVKVAENTELSAYLNRQIWGKISKIRTMAVQALIEILGDGKTRG